MSDKLQTGPSPGPWTYNHHSEGISDANGEHIGVMEPASGPLAASAPDLLKALLWLVPHDTAECGACERSGGRWKCPAHRAIARATGSQP